ncbi:MAG: hypothetical protein R3D62_15210 [Xanthobacteraceae bacterium]
MTLTSNMLRAGLLALGVAALSAPAFAQGTGAASGGASNAPSGSNMNNQATPGTAATGGTYPSHNQYGTTGSGAYVPPNTGSAAPSGGVNPQRPRGPASGNE